MNLIIRGCWALVFLSNLPGVAAEPRDFAREPLRMATAIAPMYPDVNAFRARPKMKLRGNNGQLRALEGGQFWDPYWQYFVDDERPPYVDHAAFAACLERYEVFCRKMQAEGFNAVTLGDVIHVITLDHLDPADPYAVFARDNPYRLRHTIRREYYNRMIATAHRHGLQFLLLTDEFAYTPEIERWITSNGRPFDYDNPRTWQAYREKYRELFRVLPALDGVMVRVGELYGYGPYYGKAIVNKMGQDPARYSRLVRETYDVVVGEFSRLYVHRTWSLGTNGIHMNPALYRAVFDPIPLPNLLIGVKSTAHDFWFYSGDNPTMGIGRHPQMIEFQAHYEYDGKGVIPCTKVEVVSAAARLAARQGNRSVWVWPAEGGPDGSANLSAWEAVPYFGRFPYWNEANVHLIAQMVQRPESDPKAVLRQWAAKTFGAGAAAAVAEMLVLSEGAVRDTLYTQPYAAEHPAMPLGAWWFDLGAKPLVPLTQPMSADAFARLYDGFTATPLTTARMVGLIRGAQPGFTDASVYAAVLHSVEHLDALARLMCAWRQASMLSAVAAMSPAQAADYPRVRQTLEAALSEYDRTYGAFKTQAIRASLKQLKPNRQTEN
jgi:hypothetical protein